MSSGGHLLVQCLQTQGVERIFCVPGESYLDVLDGLHDSGIQTVIARHEGGAAMMAEADGKLTGRPGIAMVTRGPGATNAASGVHVAQQDSTALILFVGQVGRDMIGRDAFQEVDYRGLYGGMAKAVIQIEDPARIPEIVSRAFHLAMSGRPGPVVVPLPEDMLTEQVTAAAPVARIEVAEPAPDPVALERLAELLARAEQPFLLLGGSRWNADAVHAAAALAEAWRLPVGCQFRRQTLFDAEHPHYAGDVGLGVNPALAQRIRAADLLILLGGRLPEAASGGYTLVEVPTSAQTVVHIHPDPDELGRVYAAALQINATAPRFLDGFERMVVPQTVRDNNARGKHVEQARRDYLDWSTPPGAPLALDTGQIVGWLRDHLPADSIITNGAGNHTQWLHRFYRYRGFGTQLAPTSGSMGYGLPAAVAAKLRHPHKTVVCLCGDGSFQMTAMELATAVQYRVPIIVLVFDNRMHGTIRMHQERSYPGRVTATELVNPDFCAMARAFDAHGEFIVETGEFEAAFRRAQAAGKPALIHIQADPEVILPGASLTDIRRLVLEST